MKNTRTLRILQAAASMLALAAAWQILSYAFPPFLFPPVPAILSRTIEILITGSLLWDVLLTAWRIFAGLFGAFIVGGVIGAVIIWRKKRQDALAPPSDPGHQRLR